MAQLLVSPPPAVKHAAPVADCPGIAQIALAGALLDEIERDGYQVLHQRIALTPIRKLWIAWRAARRR